MTRKDLLFGSVVVLLSMLAHAPGASATTLGDIFVTVRGVVLDPQHVPIAGATVTIQAARSAWTQTVKTNSNGEFSFSNVTVGDYTVEASQQGFGTVKQRITVLSDTSPVYQFALPVAAVKAEMTVQGAPEVE